MVEYFYDVEQNSPEWDALRRGLVTSSEFHTVLAKGRGNQPSVTRRKYMLNLIADRLGAAPSDRYVNHQMERGHAMEAEAIALYEFMRDAETARVGFVRNGTVGASPDRLRDEAGLVEVKSKDRHRQLECLISGKVPAEHMVQLQGQLWVCEREWVDFVSYWPGLDLFVKRVHRDDSEIERISNGVDLFLSEMNQLLESLQALVCA